MKVSNTQLLPKSLILLLLVVFSTQVQGQEITKDSISLSLEQAWTGANAHSKELRIKHYETGMGKEGVLDAKNEWLPKIRIHGQYGQLSNIPVFNNGINNDADFIHLEDHTSYDAGIETYFNVYNGGKTKLHLQKAETKEDLLKILEEENSSQIHYKVAQAYLDMQRSMAFEKLVKNNIYRNDRLLDQITKLYDNGVVLKSDLLRAQLQLSRQNTRFMEMENNVALARQSLNILIGYPDDQPIKPIDGLAFTLPGRDFQINIKEAVEGSPQEEIAKKQIEIKALEEKEMKTGKLPKLGVFGEYSYSYPQIKLYPYETSPYLLGMAGIKLTYDISNIYHDKHKEVAAKIAVEKQELAKQHLEDNLRKKITAAYKHFQEDLQKIEVAKMNIEQAKENYRIVNQTYFNQLSLLTDLLDADDQLLQAKFELVNSQIMAKIHYYELLNITGKL
ncbi:TolC family protein [Aequorivita capsosiphonis]|uniref:TolC family protein n=1 Tax=Aequorivita capsosiphonis TaxID=487317 RepID=UPI000400E22D|nr:TolC family protein [Aequorivita capsosiphonis]